jgi:hypothetical protein
VSFFNKCSHTHSQVCFKINTSKGFALGLKFVNSSTSLDSNRPKDCSGGIKPDICVYRAADSNITGTDSSMVEIIIEFKWNRRWSDPFTIVRLPEDKLIKYPNSSTDGTQDTLGQITEYVAAHLGSQFRTHIYSVLVGKQTATILRCVMNRYS